jgi:hypothetical protein
MVCHHLGFDPIPTEAEIASWIDGPRLLMDLPARYDQIQAVYDRLKIGRKTSPVPLALSEIMSAIDGGSPIAADLEWASGGGHCILLVAYSPIGYLGINDPERGQGWASYQEVVSAYGLGRATVMDYEFVKE